MAELRETERRLKSAQSVAHIGSWELDLANKTMWGSDEAARVYGLDQEDADRLPLDTVQKICLDEDRPHMDQAMEDLMAGRAEYKVQFRIRRANDGEIRSIYSLANMVPGDDGGPGKIVGIIQDITERLRSEESLRQSEERFQRFIERSPVAIAITNAEQAFEYINPKFIQTYGYDLHDIPDLDAWWVKAYPDPLYRQEVTTEWIKRVREAHSTGTEVSQVERMVRCKDGTDKIVSFHAAPVGDKVMVILLDVTTEREAGRALKESEAKFRRFVEASPVGIHMFRHLADGRLEFTGYNPAADRILGIDHRPLLGQDVMEAFPFLAGTEIPAHYIRVADEGVMWQGDEVTYEQGRIAGAYEVMAFQISAGNMAAMFNDITQRLRGQEELRIMEQQLFRSQKLEALGTLASGIAHDFNNILQALRGRIDLLAYDHSVPEATRRHIETMERSIVRASQLVARMLSFSRTGEYKLTVLNLNHEVLSAVEMLIHALPRMVEIQTEFSAEECLVMGDSNRLEQVILNLATNARDAMPNGGTLRFKTLRRTIPESGGAETGLKPGEYVVLEVSDNGQGMSGKTLDHIFEPFFSTKESGKGTGWACTRSSASSASTAAPSPARAARGMAPPSPCSFPWPRLGPRRMKTDKGTSP